MKHMPTSPRKASSRATQRGVSLVFALIAVVVFLISAVAIVRSFNSSLFQAGNLAFKRDLTNQSERAMDAVFARMQGSGALASEAARSAHQAADNYSASILPANAQGIPNALLNAGDASSGATARDVFYRVGSAANDIELTDPNGTTFGSVRYVVERLCNATGDAGTIGPSGCIYAGNARGPSGGALQWIRADITTTGGGGGAGATSQQVMYRATIRVNGPRGTQGFFQTTFSR
jgi:type IV pilus assembly protein PilX